MRKNLTRTADPLRDAAQQLLHIEIFCERRCANMEKYTKAQMEVIEFENEDVITTSSIKICTSTDYDNVKPDPSDGSCIWAD